MSEPQSSNGAISVIRFPDNGTNLVETWVLSSLYWEDAFLGEGEPEPKVKCYVSRVNDTTGPGSQRVGPHKDVSVSDTIPVSEAPDEVRRAFVDQLNALSDLGDSLDQSEQDSCEIPDGRWETHSDEDSDGSDEDSYLFDTGEPDGAT